MLSPKFLDIHKVENGSWSSTEPNETLTLTYIPYKVSNRLDDWSLQTVISNQ